jgi:hypothetical protein
MKQYNFTVKLNGTERVGTVEASDIDQAIRQLFRGLKAEYKSVELIDIN